MNGYHGHPDQHFGSVTYSQHGEDLMLLNIFDLLSIEKPSYLDIGAHHPVNISNTKLLYDRGSRGVNVEANPNLFGAFLEQRPEDVNLCMGVGLINGLADFYMYDRWSGRNTFSLEETKTLTDVLTVKETVRTPIRTLNFIVETYCNNKFPNLLTIDIEGLDLPVIESADFSESSPLVVVTEVRPKDTNAMIEVMHKKDFFLYCRMGENLIFAQSGCELVLYHGK